MISIYRSIMDSNVNPLRNLPAAQRLQLMLFLSVMWTNIFCLSAGAWIWYGELIVFHVLVVPASSSRAWSSGGRPRRPPIVPIATIP